MRELFFTKSNQLDPVWEPVFAEEAMRHHRNGARIQRWEIEGPDGHGYYDVSPNHKFDLVRAYRVDMSNAFKQRDETK